MSKPFPWGAVLGSAALGLALVALLVYAAFNQGSGIDPLVRDPDSAIEGVQVAEGPLSQSHVAGPVDYESLPPNSGDHNGTPQQCAVYTEPIAPEHAVHSMEHGAVWVTYNDALGEDDIEALRAQVEGNPYRLMSPLPDQESPIVLSAWGRTLEADSADDEAVDRFLRGYTNGPQTPEKGAGCVGNTTTGPLAPAPAPPPGESPDAVPGESPAPEVAPTPAS